MSLFERPVAVRRSCVRASTASSFALAFLLLFLTVIVWLIGSHNPYTPAGYVGYLTKGAVFGKARFHGIQRGPTSAGRGWLLEVTNVSITPYTYNEDFTRDDAVLSRDNLKIAFRVHTVWRVDDTRIPLFMERFSTTSSGGTSEKDPDADREGRIRAFRARAAPDLRARRGAAPERNGGQGRAHPDRRCRAPAHPRVRRRAARS